MEGYDIGEALGEYRSRAICTPINIKRGQTLILRHGSGLTIEQEDRIRARVERALPDNKVFILQDGLEIVALAGD